MPQLRGTRQRSSLEKHRRLAEDTPRGTTLGRLAGNSRFRRLWVAQFVSGIGDWLVIGLLIPLVTTLSGGSSFAVAGILIAKIVPALLFSSVTGVLVDRVDRRTVMIVSDVARAVLTLFLLFTNSLAIIYLVVLLMETGSLFFYPARNALIPCLLDTEDDIAAANGLAYTTQQGAMIVGLTASGAIIAGFEGIVRSVLAANLPIVTRMVGVLSPALLGPRAGVLLNSFTFLFSAVTVWTIHVSSRPERDTGERFDISLIGRDVLDSFRFLRDHQELRGLLVTIFLAILGGGAIIPVGLVFVRTHLSGTLLLTQQVPMLARLTAAPETFILVFLALGMTAGALVAPRLERHMSLQLMFAGSVTTFGAGMIIFSGISKYWLAGMLAVLAGACVAMVTVAGNTYVVRTVDDQVRGRVFTALESVIRVALLISMIVMAPIGDILASLLRRFVAAEGLPPQAYFTGTRLTMFFAGVVVLAAAVYAWRTLTWRRADSGPAEGAAGV